MSTYVVGDIQGCFGPFQALLGRIGFDPGADQLWSVGDLINRGPDNLATLRCFFQHRDCVKVVLGNHDLHLLATRAGAGRMGKSDNFQDILEAPDADDLMDWLQQQPLMHQEDGNILVHAGIPPCWNSEQALALSQEVSAALQSPRATDFFMTMYGNEPYRWSPHLSGLARLRVITNYFTRMRYCTATGALDLKSKGPQPKVPMLGNEVLKPWFEHPNQLAPDERVFFGHWASLEGKTNNPQFMGLDTGCVWGRELTVYCVESKQTYTTSGSSLGGLVE